MSITRRVFIATVIASGLAFAAPRAAPEKEMVTNYIIAEVPEGTGNLYITGSAKQMGPWKPKGQKMYADGNRRIYAFEAEVGYSFEYKFTKGSWKSEALGEDGEPLRDNYSFTVTRPDEVVIHIIPGFKKS